VSWASTCAQNGRTAATLNRYPSPRSCGTMRRISEIQRWSMRFHLHDMVLQHLAPDVTWLLLEVPRSLTPPACSGFSGRPTTWSVRSAAHSRPPRCPKRATTGPVGYRRANRAVGSVGGEHLDVDVNTSSYVWSQQLRRISR